mmetsp:Transcript_128496/g.209343  ORF Transcript_128496/g.209343 Transcript_128496/m.209343 type:complete len:156 (+) Transcript_128496:3-470(+)
MNSAMCLGLPDGVCAQTFTSGPCHEDRVLCLFRTGRGAGEESAVLQGDAIRLDVHCDTPGFNEFFLAEPAVAVQAAQDAPVTGVLMLQGCAVWSSMQLLSEISRHRWGLCEAKSDDLPFAEGSDSANLWETCWRDRAPLWLPERTSSVSSHRSEN